MREPFCSGYIQRRRECDSRRVVVEDIVSLIRTSILKATLVNSDAAIVQPASKPTDP
jgi:hypothetical protein